MPTCPVCHRSIDLRESTPIVVNPQGLSNEQVMDAYERAKEHEATSPSKGIVRTLYTTAGLARLGHTHGQTATDVPADELVILGRALFELGAKSYAVHHACVTSDAFTAWMDTKIGTD